MESLTRNQLELLAHCGHKGAIERLERKQTTYQFDGKTTVTVFNIENWFGELATWGTICLVHAALACSREALSFVEEYRWLDECSHPLLFAADRWAFEPTIENARLAHKAAQQTDELAKLAVQRSTIKGDWLSYQIVVWSGLIPTAIAVDSGLMKSDNPGGACADLLAACNGFTALPTNDKRNPFATRDAVCQRIISWLLECDD